MNGKLDIGYTSWTHVYSSSCVASATIELLFHTMIGEHVHSYWTGDEYSFCRKNETYK